MTVKEIVEAVSCCEIPEGSCSECPLGHGDFYLDSFHIYPESEIARIDEAMKKQIPKKVERRKGVYGNEYGCPECGSDLIHVAFCATDKSKANEKVSWCWACGQKLLWEDDSN